MPRTKKIIGGVVVQESNDLKRLKLALRLFNMVQLKWQHIGGNDSETNIALSDIMDGANPNNVDWGLFEENNQAVTEFRNYAIRLKKIADESESMDVIDFLVATNNLRDAPPVPYISPIIF